MRPVRKPMPTTRYNEPDDLVIQRWQSPWGDIVATTHTGLVREKNEDAIGVSDDGMTIAISDGMGGHAKGAEASREAVRNAIGAAHPRVGFAAAQNAVAAMGKDRVGVDVPGCTLVVARVDESRNAIVGWTGDSRAYLWDGRLTQVTRDHAVGKFTLAKCLGAFSQDGDRAEFVEAPIVSGAWLLLCSDGLHGYASDGAMADALKAAQCRAEESLRRLVGLAFANEAPDNVSAMIVRMR